MRAFTKRKRNKAIIALLLPVIIFLWMIGWSLYWTGSLQKRRRKAQPERRKDSVSIMAMVLEELPEIVS